MAAGITDTLSRVTDSTTGRPVVAQLANPGKAIGAASININDATNWTTETVIHFSIFETVTVAGYTIKNTETQTDWKGVLAGTTITNLTLTGGTDREYTAGALVELTPTARYAKDLYDNIRSHANQDGSLIPAAVQAALNLGSSSLNGWSPLAYTPNTITYNGNRSYDLVFNGVDITGTLSNGMRLRTTRTTAAPTQCASLNGVSQYFSKPSPAGMTFTDDFVVSVWIKLSSYAAAGIVSRYNGTSGWALLLESDGRISLRGLNGGSGNASSVTSYQSVPLNKWVHITAQLDMSAFTTTSTTSYIMIDGMGVPCIVSRTGTNPTALVQAGNLEIGSYNGGTAPFPGKIAQAAIYGTKVAADDIRTTISQGLSGSETSLISAYSFNNSLSDLKAASANDLTANGSATAANTDSPFAQDDTGAPGGSLDFGIVTSKSFSTNTTLTVQVPEGCTIPTSGGISAVAYATEKVPYGFPSSTNRWIVQARWRVQQAAKTNTSYAQNYGDQLTVPTGAWRIIAKVPMFMAPNATTTDAKYALSTSTTALSDISDVIRLNNNASVNTFSNGYREALADLTAATTIYGIAFTSLAAASYTVDSDDAEHSFTAELAYL